MHVLLNITKTLKNHYALSVLKKYITGKSLLQSAYENSLLCFLVCNIYKLLCFLSGKLFNIFFFLSKGGIIHSLFIKIKDKKYISFTSILSFYIVAMIICPHEIWNNLYAVLAAFAFLFAYMVLTYKKLETPDIKTEGFGLIIFIIFSGFSVVYAFNRADALRIVMFLYSAIIFSFLIKQSVNSASKLINVIKIISFGAFLTSVIGIFQRIAGVEVNTEYVDIAMNSSMPGRVYSTFANPNNFAELLVLTMPCTLSLVFISNKSRQKLIWGAFLLTDFAAIGMSYSRSCWIALLIAAVVMLLIYDWRLLVPCIILGIALIPFLPESILNRILTIGSMKDTSNASRLYIWEGAWKLVKGYFVSGVGAGPLTFAKYYQPIADPLAKTAPHSHMLYMELIIEFGICAFIGFLLYMIFSLKKAFAAVSCIDKDGKAIIGALVGSLFGIFFVFAVEYVWFYPRDMFMFWIIVGLLAAASKHTILNQKNNLKN